MNKFKKIFKILSPSLFLFFPFLVLAQGAGLIDGSKVSDMSGEFAAGAGFSNIGLGSVVATIVSIALSLLALIFLVLTIMAGFKWMNAGGNEEDVKKAQTSLKNSLIGLIIILSAYAITYFIFNTLPFSGGGSTLPPAV